QVAGSTPGSPPGASAASPRPASVSYVSRSSKLGIERIVPTQVAGSTPGSPPGASAACPRPAPGSGLRRTSELGVDRAVPTQVAGSAPGSPPGALAASASTRGCAVPTARRFAARFDDPACE